MWPYKCNRAGVWSDKASTAYSTQACSWCNKRSGLKDRKGLADLEDLGTGEWTCSGCGAEHHCDANAAKDILAAGHDSLAQGIPRLDRTSGSPLGLGAERLAAGRITVLCVLGYIRLQTETVGDRTNLFHTSMPR
jgi:putative transposase